MMSPQDRDTNWLAKRYRSAGGQIACTPHSPTKPPGSRMNMSLDRCFPSDKIVAQGTTERELMPRLVGTGTGQRRRGGRSHFPEGRLSAAVVPDRVTPLARPRQAREGGGCVLSCSLASTRTRRGTASRDGAGSRCAPRPHLPAGIAAGGQAGRLSPSRPQGTALPTGAEAAAGPPGPGAPSRPPRTGSRDRGSPRTVRLR